MKLWKACTLFLGFAGVSVATGGIAAVAGAGGGLATLISIGLYTALGTSARITQSITEASKDKLKLEKTKYQAALYELEKEAAHLKGENISTKTLLQALIQENTVLNDLNLQLKEEKIEQIKALETIQAELTKTKEKEYDNEEAGYHLSQPTYSPSF